MKTSHWSMSSTQKFGAQRFGGGSKAGDSSPKLKLQMTMSAFKEKYTIKGMSSNKNEMIPTALLETASNGGQSQSGNNDATSDQILDNTQNFGFTHTGAFDVTFNTKFQPLSPIKRRSPDQYIRNPTKVYGVTYGKKEFLWLESAKESIIKTHDNTKKSDKT